MKNLKVVLWFMVVAFAYFAISLHLELWNHVGLALVIEFALTIKVSYMVKRLKEED